jgi:hypothetical protein
LRRGTHTHTRFTLQANALLTHTLTHTHTNAHLMHPPCPCAEEKKEKKEAGEKKAEEEEEEEDSEEESGGQVRKAAGGGAAPSSGGGGGGGAAAAAAQAPAAAAPRFGAELAALLAAPRDEKVRGDTAKACKGAKDADVLLALEWACRSGGAPALKAVPIALEGLYDAEALSEPGIMAWYSGAEGSAEVKARAKAFVDWLAEAEEED